MSEEIISPFVVAFSGQSPTYHRCIVVGDDDCVKVFDPVGEFFTNCHVMDGWAVEIVVNQHRRVLRNIDVETKGRRRTDTLWLVVAERDAANTEIAEMKEQIKRLREERDEARREVCEFEASIEPTILKTLHSIAQLRGWDCYDEEADANNKAFKEGTMK